MAEIRVRESAQGLRRFRRRAGFELHRRGRRILLSCSGPQAAARRRRCRMIAGLELPTSGQYPARRRGRHLPARARARHRLRLPALRALSAHERAAEHRLPAEVPGHAAAEIRRSVEEAARILRIDHLLDRPVSGLAGGDRQRVALGRAIVRRPKAFLMDEPLGTLDAEFRTSWCGELRACTIASAPPPSTSPTTSSRPWRWPTRSR